MVCTCFMSQHELRRLMISKPRACTQMKRLHLFMRFMSLSREAYSWDRMQLRVKTFAQRTWTYNLVNSSSLNHWTVYKQNQADSNKCFANVGFFPSLSCLIYSSYSQWCLISDHFTSWHPIKQCVRSKISFYSRKLSGKAILMRKINPPCPSIYISQFSTNFKHVELALMKVS